ncbi:hypothetical protein TcasGA2_TC011097 [Tribolium castaneum]|uniref:Vesicular, overexpressed in cancer, prosurvival protein 1 n=1 Tax=Tribolium castaneum TaxID=7070 RepID=D6X4B8_TRICA|nr:hypothetical protein TcasGA2_TC011097 [Tribolium castaneum]
MIRGSHFCIIQEEKSYKLIYCNLEFNHCCDKGCCKETTFGPIYVTKIDQNHFPSTPTFPTYVWLVLVLGVFCYILLYICHILKKNDDESSTPPQTPELNLTLSFNQSGAGNFNMHLPAIPLTPRTPPPGYMTLTPPPTYSAAIHFPPIGEKMAETKC